MINKTGINNEAMAREKEETGHREHEKHTVIPCKAK